MYKKIISVLIIVIVLFSLDCYSQKIEENMVFVMYSDDPKLNANEVVPTSTKLQLHSGKVAHLIPTSGNMYIVTGPFEGLIQDTLTDERGVFSEFMDIVNLLISKGYDRSKDGAYRGTTKNKSNIKYNPEKLKIDTGVRATVCLEGEQKLILKLEKNSKNDSKLFLEVDRNNSYTYNIERNQEEFTVDKSILQKNPKRLVFSYEEQEKYTKIRVFLKTKNKNMMYQLLWFDQNGCQQQFLSALAYYKSL